ncbi:MAG TPA: sugar phosphate isomerase/epimerase [Firmicutes bacterium]|nr:sugar phosphate isomerase/epimerase [Bacillota bacterium]
MKIGLMTACLPELSLRELVSWARDNGLEALELACWPVVPTEKRRYGNASHIDVAALTPTMADEIKMLFSESGLDISSLAYYPNNLDPDPARRAEHHDHLKKVIRAASLLGVNLVGTFVGRDPNKTVPENLELVKVVWPDLVKFAEDNGVRLMFENCPMMYTWPGGTNVFFSPEIWDAVFEILPSKNLGINMDPSHLIWQGIDYEKAASDYRDRIFHTHAKDTKILPDVRGRVGVYSSTRWWVDRLPGLGDIDWRKWISALVNAGYDGVISIEHEDRNWEGSTEKVQRGILFAKKYLEVLMPC